MQNTYLPTSSTYSKESELINKLRKRQKPTEHHWSRSLYLRAASSLWFEELIRPESGFNSATTLPQLLLALASPKNGAKRMKAWGHTVGICDRSS